MVRDIGIALRLSAVTVGKAKAELVETTRAILAESDGEAAVFESIDRFADIAERLKTLGGIVAASHTAAVRFRPPLLKPP